MDKLVCKLRTKKKNNNVWSYISLSVLIYFLPPAIHVCLGTEKNKQGRVTLIHPILFFPYCNLCCHGNLSIINLPLH